MVRVRTPRRARNVDSTSRQEASDEGRTEAQRASAANSLARSNAASSESGTVRSIDQSIGSSVVFGRAIDGEILVVGLLRNELGLDLCQRVSIDGSR